MATNLKQKRRYTFSAGCSKALRLNLKVYDQWEWQQHPTIWRRYPCTISHKLNSVLMGETIYVTIYEWVYIITKHTPISGTQTNLFTQTTRKIRIIGTSEASYANEFEQKEEEMETKESSLSLYYNYSYANVVMIATLKDNEERVKKLFFSSISSSDYEITLLTQVQLSQNNKQYENYRTNLTHYCDKYRKEKYEIETLLWSNCSVSNKQYAHLHNAHDIIQKATNDDHHYLVYLCRAIYIMPDHVDDDDHDSDHLLDPNPIDSQHVMDQIPLYLINFKSIGNGFYSDPDDEDDGNMVAKSLFNFANDATLSEESHSLHSYSQPLLSLKDKDTLSAQRKKNNYGTTEKYNPSDFDKTWLELVQQEDAGYFASTFDVNVIIDKLWSVRHKKPGTKVQIKRSDIENICIYSKTLFMQQPVLLELESPINIVGDIHGQYFDLLRLLDYGLHPPESNYLFLGDYVDRGGQSVECLCLLLCYKIKYEENFFLLRGNHENENINRIYGFYDECKRRYSVRVWRKFVDVFNHLPIAATISDKIFCVHGGLSPALFPVDYDAQRLSFDDSIKGVQRPTTVGDYGLVCDLLWSDPSFEINGWDENEDRGVSYVFGRDIVSSFNKSFELDLVCRAHQVVEDGYEFFSKRQLVTIFSAPNYCGEFDNCAAFMKVDEYLKCSFVTLDPQKGYKSQIIKRNF